MPQVLVPVATNRSAQLLPLQLLAAFFRSRLTRRPRHHLLLCALSLLAALVSASALLAQPAPTSRGVSRALAQERKARVSDLHYNLSLTLQPHAESMPGTESLSFTLASAGTSSDLLLDYRDGKLLAAKLNGTPVSATLADGHLVLPKALLRVGGNTVETTFASRIAAAGAAITRYTDKTDGSEYLYSLFVPMDASMAFPCFDQPDLKARFLLTVDHDPGWTIISNAKPDPAGPGLAANRSTFPETRPISTYLFAFAAGPWVRMAGAPGQSDVYVRKSQVERAEPEIPQLQAITAQGMSWLADYFHQPFPFPKYDMVLIPGFPFGGMEHAGATFLNEDGVLFRSAPTESDRFRRNILTLHELTHQWFGDLVTMQWFDDLWLKEGFAQYMAYRCLDALQPQSQPWKHFYEDIKPLAYGIDETPGTTPIFQDIPNLQDAKSAYGAIVYQKAPAILKQLEFRLGQDNFQKGLQLYLAQHAYANAQWADLIGAFHAASGQDVRSWADAWVLRRGMPEVNASWTCDAGGNLKSLKLTQRDVLPDGYVWPLSNQVVLAPSMQRLRVDWSAAETNVLAAIGKPCPAYVFANPDDQAYGRFLLDARSEASVRAQLPLTAARPQAAVPAPLLRSMLWGALWENVRVAQSAPRSYVDLVFLNLPYEDDETLARIEGGHATTALQGYMTDSGRAPLVSRLEEIATQRMLHASTLGLRIVNFRTLTSVTETRSGTTTLKDLLAGKLNIPGVELRPLDRWNMIGRLAALNDSDAASLLTAELASDHSGDGPKYAWAVQAGAPDPKVKDSYFAQYLAPPSSPDAKPEDWLTLSLRPFNNPSQASITQPFLRRALDQLPEIKRDRKIFFLGAWLNAFFDGQISPDAESTVQRWLAQTGTDPDLRRKVLENNDELARTVRIRQRFPD